MKYPPSYGCFQKWMVKIMENLIKMDDLGGKPTFFGNTHMFEGPPKKGATARWILSLLHMTDLIFPKKVQVPSQISNDFRDDFLRDVKKTYCILLPPPSSQKNT